MLTLRNEGIVANPARPFTLTSVHGFYPDPVGASLRSAPRVVPPSTLNVQLSTVFPKSPHQYHSMGLTLHLFSYSYALFCTAENPISNRFILFHTLSAKHPGGVYPRNLKPPHLSTVSHHPGSFRYLLTSLPPYLDPFPIP